MFNQNLEPNVVIYEHITVPKQLGFAPKFGKCWVQNQIPGKARGSKNLTLGAARLPIPSLLMDGKESDYRASSIILLPLLFPQFPPQPCPPAGPFWGQQCPLVSNPQEHIVL